MSKLFSSQHACAGGFGGALNAIPMLRRWPPSLARAFTVAFVWNVAFALVFTLLGMLFSESAAFWSTFWPNLVFAQCIGFLIWFAYTVLGRMFPGIRDRGPVVRMIYFTSVPLVCVLIGMWIASGIIGGASLRYWIMQPRNITVMSGVSLVISCVLLLIYIPRERAARAEAAVAREGERVAAAERATTLAHMKLLEAQIEPHFLYNTLAHVDSLIQTDASEARRMLASLTALLRATARSATDRATLGSQIASTRAYLELLQMRMGTRLAWTIDIEPGLADVALPPAMLQPLVENAVKHGLEPQLRGGNIAISARRTGDLLEVRVDDTGGGFSATGTSAHSTGIGLANLRARLVTLYGDRASLVISDNEPTGARVALTLPLA